MRRALLSALALSACATPPTPMRVLVQPPAYVVSVSSTRGLGLTPIAEAPPGVTVRYRWTADGGHFLAQEETTTLIVDLGRETVTEGGKLFWSYAPGDQLELEGRPVAITVRAVNAKTGKELAWTRFALTWDGQYFRARH